MHEEKYKTYTFDNVVLFARTGLNPRDNFKLGQGNNKYITIKNIQNNELIFDKNTDVVDDDAIKLIHKRSQIQKGDILFASIGRIGDMYIIQDEPNGWDINESVFAFTLNTKIIQQKYFYYIFKNQTTLDYLKNNSSGSTFKSIKMNQLKRMTFLLPSLEEQNRISLKLDKCNKIINNYKRIIEKYDMLIKSRFIEMFGDPITNPKHWNTKAITELCENIMGGGTPSKSKPEYFEGTIPWVSPKDMKSLFILDSQDHITEDAVNNSSAKKIKSDSILMVIRSGILKHTLPVAMNKVEVTINQDMKAFIPSSEINPYYLLFYFKGIERDVLSGVRAVTADNIDFNQFKKRHVILPPKQMQDDFASFVQQIDKSKFVVQQSLEKVELFYKSLMQEYFG